jgi:hypothetical protein
VEFVARGFALRYLLEAHHSEESRKSKIMRAVLVVVFACVLLAACADAAPKAKPTKKDADAPKASSKKESTKKESSKTAEDADAPKTRGKKESTKKESGKLAFLEKDPKTNKVLSVAAPSASALPHCTARPTQGHPRQGGCGR